MVMTISSHNATKTDGNNLTGTIPSELATLTNLQHLSFSGGEGLTGTLPDSFGESLTDLRFLQFAFTQIGGTIPASFAGLRRLKTWFLPVNAFTGSLPQGLFSEMSTSLIEMHLGTNYLTGSLESIFPVMPNLRQIYLDNNLFTGSIPPRLYEATNLNALSFSGNTLSGHVSTRLGDLDKLQFLRTDRNYLSGTIPSEIGKLSDLEYLFLNHNQFSGPIPSEVGRLSRLIILYMQRNNLSGSVPLEFAALEANQVTLHLNNLTGNLDMFCNQTSLLALVGSDCSGNNSLVDCPCCTTCCDGVDESSCEINLEGLCEIEKSSVEDERGGRYIETAGANCNCEDTAMDANNNETASSINLSCTDTGCLICNRDKTVCATQEDYIFSLSGQALFDYYRVTFRYVVGRNDTVVYESTYDPFLDYYNCQVTVNDQLCDSCQPIACADGFFGNLAVCDNLGISQGDFCTPEARSALGPLAIFALQDPQQRAGGCSPRFYPTI